MAAGNRTIAVRGKGSETVDSNPTKAEILTLSITMKATNREAITECQYTIILPNWEFIADNENLTAKNFVISFCFHFDQAELTLELLYGC